MIVKVNTSSIDALAEAAVSISGSKVPPLSPSLPMTNINTSNPNLSPITIDAGLPCTDSESIYCRQSSLSSLSAEAPAQIPSNFALPQAKAADYASMVQVQSKFDSTVTAPSRRRKPNFAEKLHAVLSSKECRHAVAWLPSGRSFCITDQEEFVKYVLPKFFREAKFESFSRRLKRWGFRKVYTTGLSQTMFSHDKFHRDRPDLCSVMNGREKVGAAMLSHCQQIERADSTGSAGVASQVSQSSFDSQGQFLQALLLRQAKARQQALFQQQFGLVRPHAAPVNPFISTTSTQTLTSGKISCSNVDADAQAMIRKAQDLVARTISASTADPLALNPNNIFQAEMDLARLNDDIANCEEQLIVLQKLKELKEEKRHLTGDVSRPRGVSPVASGYAPLSISKQV